MSRTSGWRRISATSGRSSSRGSGPPSLRAFRIRVWLVSIRVRRRVRAGLRAGHPTAGLAEKRLVVAEGGDADVVLVEDPVSGGRRVVSADAGLIPADDVEPAAVVLPDDGQEERGLRTGYRMEIVSGLRAPGRRGSSGPRVLRRPEGSPRADSPLS